MMGRRVRLRVPENVTLTVEDRVLRTGDEIERDCDATVEQWLAAGFVTEVETAQSLREVDAATQLGSRSGRGGPGSRPPALAFRRRTRS